MRSSGGDCHALEPNWESKICHSNVKKTVSVEKKSKQEGHPIACSNYLCFAGRKVRKKGNAYGAY